jgi:xanthine dehydrogenase accessory factor
MREVLTRLLETLGQGRECIYCAVVETRGSTPQKAGAAMLVYPDGTQFGTLGGGCVEAEVKQRALQVLANKSERAELLKFTLDDNYGWDDGLICGGRMTILADPARKSTASYYRCFAELIAAGKGGTEAVAVEDKSHGTSPGSRYLFDADAKIVGHLGSDLNGLLAEGIQPVRHRPKPAVRNGVAYLPILPRVTLFIVGAGHVGQAVARLAAEVDFDVWVLDDRETFANRDRFPSASRVLVGNIGTTLKEFPTHEIDASVFCMIVTRGHAHDEEALLHLVSRPAGYVGMIGSKRKIKMIFEDLIAMGVAPEALATVHAPLGFAIGSQTVPEIAISIVAELIACRNLGKTISEARVWVKPGPGRIVEHGEGQCTH